MADANRASAVEPLWTSAEAAAATGGRAVGRWLATGVSIDTRDLAAGSLFVALKDKRDGHDFVPAAYGAGAGAALVERRVGDGPALVVPNALKGLEALGVAARDRCPARRVGVTGSVGKTSMKEALALIFRAAGRGHASEKSYNNHWGVPLSLARMPRATERAVFEMGMNHSGEIRALSAMVKPHIGVVTKIAPAHLENLGSMEAIADAKAEIFEHLDNWGAAVIPGDDEFAERLGERAGAAGAGWLVRFGADRQAEARVTDFVWTPESASGRVDVFGQTAEFSLRTGGAHWGAMAAGALAAAYLADVPLGLAAEALSEFGALAGRGVVSQWPVGGGDVTVIDETYNANPTSMQAAIESLGAREPGAGGKRIAVLGAMMELGPESDALHARLAPVLEAARVDVVHVVGAQAEPLFNALPASLRGVFLGAHLRGNHGSSLGGTAEICATLLQQAGAGDVILIKGSNAVGLSAVVDGLRTALGG